MRDVYFKGWPRVGIRGRRVTSWSYRRVAPSSMAKAKSLARARYSRASAWRLGSDAMRMECEARRRREYVEIAETKECDDSYYRGARQRTGEERRVEWETAKTGSALPILLRIAFQWSLTMPLSCDAFTSSLDEPSGPTNRSSSLPVTYSTLELRRRRMQKDANALTVHYERLRGSSR